MSRIGKMPIQIPGGVTVAVEPERVSVSGPKGNLQQPALLGIKVSVIGDEVLVSRSSDEAASRARHGLTRALINNMITGVSKGFEKKLELNGVGYRVQAQGETLKFSLGFSHEVIYKIGSGVSVSVDQNVITLTGADKQRVGQVAAEIRALKKPEPYKGKGIRYQNEKIRRKAGKSAKEKSGE